MWKPKGFYSLLSILILHLLLTGCSKEEDLVDEEFEFEVAPFSGENEIIFNENEVIISPSESVLDNIFDSADEDSFPEPMIDSIEPSAISSPLYYRPWYGKANTPRWCPKQSKFKGRTGGTHGGIDIHAPKGTKIFSILSVKSKLKKNPGSGGANSKWGKHIFLTFNEKKDGKTYQLNLVYAHLDAITASTGDIEPGEQVGRTGCTGNSGSKTYCDKPNVCEKKERAKWARTDHVHIEIITPLGYPTNCKRIDVTNRKWKYSKIDPACYFDWEINHENNSDCFFLDANCKRKNKKSLIERLFGI